MNRLIPRLIVFTVFALLAIFTSGVIIQWTYNRIYVPVGSSLLLRYKGPPLPLPFLGQRPPAKRGTFAKVDEQGRPLEVGILKDLKGPGRHFYCPLWWERKIVPDVVIEPGEVGIVVSKMGKSLEKGGFLVDGDLDSTQYKGILRMAFGPGRYRVNPYAYQFKKVKEVIVRSGSQEKRAGWVRIPPGYVGVVTNLAENPAKNQKAGIQDNVLPPGIYLINDKEQQVDVVEIGYREITIEARLKQDAEGNILYEEGGEPAISDPDSGIGFPSNDGFPIIMDFTAIWGVMPEQAPSVIRKFGNVNAVETKVVVPQIESICRNMGSKLGAVELLIGESRQKFQTDTSDEFRRVLSAKGISVMNGLVRHIHIPQEIREPIQEANIAGELKLTREQEQKTAETEALLREAEEKVALATQEIESQTEKLVAEKLAEGQKQAEETKATTKQLVAKIDKGVATLEAQATVVLGEANAKVRQFSEEARAELFGLAVSAFGTGEAYNLWVFASRLPEDVELNLLYAGQGTLWTDLKGFTDALLARQAADGQPAKAPTRNAPTTARSR